MHEVSLSLCTQGYTIHGDSKLLRIDGLEIGDSSFVRQFHLPGLDEILYHIF